MEKNTLNNRKIKLLAKVQVIVLMMIAYTVPVFADISNIGQNLGNWGIEQVGWAGLVIVACISLGFLIRKAWIPCGVFLLVGGTILYIIKHPEQLSSIGEIIFGIATK